MIISPQAFKFIKEKKKKKTVQRVQKVDYLDYMYLVKKIVLTFAIVKSFYCIFEIRFPGKLILNTCKANPCI